MKKNLPIYLYGAIIIIAGVLLIYAKENSLETLTSSLGIGLVFGSILAFYAAFSRENKQVQFAYHISHAITMLAYGFYVLLFCKTHEMLISVTAFLLMFYAFKEIIFCTWIFNLGLKISFKILIIRLLIGVLTGIGTIVSLYYQNIHTEFIMTGFGLLFVLIGTNVVLYVPLIRKD